MIYIMNIFAKVKRKRQVCFSPFSCVSPALCFTHGMGGGHYSFVDDRRWTADDVLTIDHRPQTMDDYGRLWSMVYCRGRRPPVVCGLLSVVAARRAASRSPLEFIIPRTRDGDGRPIFSLTR